jgi:hypothetical protein
VDKMPAKRPRKTDDSKPDKAIGLTFDCGNIILRWGSFPEEQLLALLDQLRSLRIKEPPPELAAILALPSPPPTKLEEMKAKAKTGDLISYATQSDLPGVGLRRDTPLVCSFDHEPKPDDLIAYSEIGGTDLRIGQFHLWDWNDMLITDGETCRMHLVRPRTVAVIVEVHRPELWQLPKRTFYNGD